VISDPNSSQPSSTVVCSLLAPPWERCPIIRDCGGWSPSECFIDCGIGSLLGNLAKVASHRTDRDLGRVSE